MVVNTRGEELHRGGFSMSEDRTLYVHLYGLRKTIEKISIRRTSPTTNLDKFNIIGTRPDARTLNVDECTLKVRRLSDFAAPEGRFALEAVDAADNKNKQIAEISFPNDRRLN